MVKICPKCNAGDPTNVIQTCECEVELKKISLKDAVKRLDKTYDLVYINYRDQIEDVDKLQEIVDTGYCDSLDDNNWIGDQSFDSATTIIKETFDDVDITDIEDELRGEIYDRDRSNPLKDLIKNTHDPVMYYNLDVEIDGCGSMGADIGVEAKKIARALKLDYKVHEKWLREIVANASYGGSLVLLFRGDFDFFYGEIHEKYVTIVDPEICVMDRWNGSGHSGAGFGDFKVRVDRTRFKLDEAAPGYSFAGDVCGMTLDATQLKPTNDIKGVIGPKTRRELTEKEKQEVAYQSKWNNTGECSRGDTNMSRHKETPYINQYPCRNECTKCHQEWID